ncbi:MAG: energy-coupling factor ABC transporter permease [Muribaculaceae bacterium]|nr:energy-coupling factor ABC transporter permease [Muribaculaceae bacterium]
MHMSDALVSPSVAIGGAVLATSLIIVASKKLKENVRQDIVPFMGVMGAFVFAAQMINFTIPGTGSSGHLIGGILLAAILGPWAAFITLCSVLIVQCLIFADGGLMALGCNILNMAATSCLLAYPLIYKPITSNTLNPGRIMLASVLASIFALELGALGVTLETELSGVTYLPFSTFLSFMLPIHLAIGAVEGIVTGLLLVFIARHRPAIFSSTLQPDNEGVKKNRSVLWIFGAIALFLAIGFTFLASEFPDGLEWSIEKVSSNPEMLETSIPPTAVLPEYNSNLSGIIGAVIVMILLYGISSLAFAGLKKAKAK